MTPRQQHLNDLGKSVTTLSSVILVAVVGFITSGEGLNDEHSSFLLSVAYTTFILAIIASLYSMFFISNRLVTKPKVGPRRAFVAANVGLVSFVVAMCMLCLVGIFELH